MQVVERASFLYRGNMNISILILAGKSCKNCSWMRLGFSLDLEKIKDDQCRCFFYSNNFKESARKCPRELICENWKEHESV